ncbi:Hypothetical Protein FCC1311_105242 [Hondaea fermentalgiana]|uniref:Uncharacterized protein n=1 Tax=Hondaea fermentalgiana TaxID=2315210 RepID=A0A2R5H0K9_9STRA|nr:Hypothetical Protein FCC1311_105242 [Hondaea fermentalgiana]|eukprot:GBG34301.1 Hypothetical Protein FCC1311_105242 [Hondaea fermentalgiana]
MPASVYISSPEKARRPNARRVTFVEADAAAAAQMQMALLLDDGLADEADQIYGRDWSASDRSDALVPYSNMERRLSAGWWRPPPAHVRDRAGSICCRSRYGRGGSLHAASSSKNQSNLFCTSLLVFVILLVSGLAGWRLLELGFFTPTSGDLPWVANGTARDRTTGVKFPLRTVPPGAETFYSLLGLSLRPGANNSWTQVSGLYVGNATVDLPSWKELADAHKATELHRAIVDSNTPLSLCVRMLCDVPGETVSKQFAEGLLPILQATYPPGATELIARDLRTLDGWFPPLLHEDQVMWLHWDHHSALRIFLDDTPEYPFGSSELGHAIFQSQLTGHGSSLTSLVHFIF